MAHAHQFGIAEESTHGTYEAPTRFHEILPGETLGLRTNVVGTSGLRPGRRVAPGGARIVAERGGGGSWEMEFSKTKMGLLLKHAIGGTPSSAQQDATAAYLHTFTLGDLPSTGLTIQKGVERADGTIVPFNLLGSRITEWGLTIAPDEFLKASFTVDALDVEDTSSIAATSYDDVDPFHFSHGALTLGESAVAEVVSCDIRGRNALKTDRKFLGSVLRSDQREEDFREITGTVSYEFTDEETFWDAWRADTGLTLVLTFTGDNIESTYDEELVVTVNDVRFQGDTPEIGSPDIPNVDAPWEAAGADDSDALVVTYQNTDTDI